MPVASLFVGGQQVSASNPVPVSGTVTASGPLTDTQLRAAAVPVDAAAKTPSAYNVTLTLALTEYSQALPASCRRFRFCCRTAVDVIYAFVTGKVVGPTAPYLTLKATRDYDSGPISQGASPSTLYLASATAGVVVEIEAWV
jgi:hypothetical protein